MLFYRVVIVVELMVLSLYIRIVKFGFTHASFSNLIVCDIIKCFRRTPKRLISGRRPRLGILLSFDYSCNRII